MKVPAEKIKARFAEFQKEGLKVKATLELNAGVKITAAAAVPLELKAPDLSSHGVRIKGQTLMHKENGE